MEIKKLSAEHYDELLELLNHTFGNKSGKPVDFLSAQPKMWVRDDEHMGCHLGAFEDGRLCAVVGVYPLRTVIDGVPFLFATTGNVATHPDYEGRGFFTALFTKAMKELEKIDADVARLGGDRLRYGRFGYEGCGTSYMFNFGGKNRVGYFGEDAGADISFAPIAATDTEALDFCRRLRMKRTIHVERPADFDYRDVYLSLCSKYCAPYLAIRNGEPVGYICSTADKKEVNEMEAADIQILGEMICAWQSLADRSIEFTLSPYDTEALRLFCRTSENFRVTYPGRFKVRNWQKLTDTLLKMQTKLRPLIDGEWILGIENYGNIRLFVKDGVAGCERTDRAAELTLDVLSVSRLLLGPMAPETVADLPSAPRSWLPLPFGWGALDAI